MRTNQERLGTSETAETEYDEAGNKNQRSIDNADAGTVNGLDYSQFHIIVIPGQFLFVIH